jgi:hypothetical protein
MKPDSNSLWMSYTYKFITITINLGFPSLPTPRLVIYTHFKFEKVKGKP